MRRAIKISAGTVEATAWLNETLTATKVLEILPVASAVDIWGDEIYFQIPVDTVLEDGKETVRLGDIAYWPQGKALCIFLGRTPVSRGDEIRPISPVNVIGKVEGSSEQFKRLLTVFKQGEKIIISS